MLAAVGLYWEHTKFLITEHVQKYRDKDSPRVPLSRVAWRINTWSVERGAWNVESNLMPIFNDQHHHILVVWNAAANRKEKINGKDLY